MKNRFIGILIGGVVVISLLLGIARMVPNRFAAKPVPPIKNGRQPGSPSLGSGAGIQAGGARPGETEAQRRTRMMSNKQNRDDFKLSEQDIYMYVQAKGSNAPSLVSAFESTRNMDYLKAAAQNYPDDPLVQAKVLMHDAIPDERGKWIEAFKKSSPDNALANFLGALDAAKRGDTKAAIAEMEAAKGKGYDEFYSQSAQGLEDAYTASGRSLTDAKALGMAEITLPHLLELKNLGRQFLDMADKAGAAGDTTTQQQMLMLNWEIGEKLHSATDKVPIITELVGVAMENATLRGWPSGLSFGDRTAGDILAGNIAERKELQTAAPVFDKWFPSAPEDEIAAYVDAVKSIGERQAFSWLKSQHPEFAQIQPPSN